MAMNTTASNRVPLRTLRAGRRFTTDFGVSGKLLIVNACRARVRLDGETTRQFVTAGGQAVSIRSARVVDWSPFTEVLIPTKGGA